MPKPNEEMRAYWNEQAGPRWVALQERLDASIGDIGRSAIEAAAPEVGEAALDVGCGCGETALGLARAVGPEGRVLGLDLSAPMLARARERAALEKLPQLSFERGDAQVRPFAGEFDLVFSRFGVMFFEDPAAAFANLVAAARPGGRLAFCCWREREKNPWMWTGLQAAAQHVELPPPPEDPHAPGPFGLHDAERLTRLLESAGWRSVALRELDVAMRPGGGVGLEEAVDFSLDMGPLPEVLAEADEGLRGRVREAVRAALAPHLTEAGVTLPGAARLVTARRPD